MVEALVTGVAIVLFGSLMTGVVGLLLKKWIKGVEGKVDNLELKCSDNRKHCGVERDLKRKVVDEKTQEKIATVEQRLSSGDILFRDISEKYHKMAVDIGVIKKTLTQTSLADLTELVKRLNEHLKAMNGKRP